MNLQHDKEIAYTPRVKSKDILAMAQKKCETDLGYADFMYLFVRLFTFFDAG